MAAADVLGSGLVAGDCCGLALTRGLAEGCADALASGEVEPDADGLASGDVSGDAAGGSWMGDADAFGLRAGTHPRRSAEAAQHPTPLLGA